MFLNQAPSVVNQQQFPHLAASFVLTMGQGLVLIGGGLDLSNGSIVSVGNVILALNVTSADEPWHNLALLHLLLGLV
jgi:ribose/xylose/arabinose/galactoside ABC-type transport system permease subunit